MKIAEVIHSLEQLAPPMLQESYDNAGLLVGSPDWECTGIICSLDATEEVVNEAIQQHCNLIVAHHPIIFSGLKKITGRNYVERTVIKAIQNNIAIYAIHTNLDNVAHGVNRKMAERLGLEGCTILSEKENILAKLVVFVPVAYKEKLKQALFSAGGGSIGKYSDCSFATEGVGTFKAGEGASPYVGEVGKRHEEKESKVEVIFPLYLKAKLLQAMKEAHPYEEVAYDLIPLQNSLQDIGSGMIGDMPSAMDEVEFLHLLKQQFNLSLIKHTPLTGRRVSKVALCGGTGSFLIKKAISAGADFYITGDVKYHEYFDAENKMVLADIGHWESEQFTTDLLVDVLEANFPTFAVQKSKVQTNPVQYFT